MQNFNKSENNGNLFLIRCIEEKAVEFMRSCKKLVDDLCFDQRNHFESNYLINLIKVIQSMHAYSQLIRFFI